MADKADGFAFAQRFLAVGVRTEAAVLGQFGVVELAPRLFLAPQGARDELETVTPGYCQFLHACRSNQLILLPREDAVARSYTALGMMAEAVLVTLGGRDFTPIAR